MRLTGICRGGGKIGFVILRHEGSARVVPSAWLPTAFNRSFTIAQDDKEIVK